MLPLILVAVAAIDQKLWLISRVAIVWEWLVMKVALNCISGSGCAHWVQLFVAGCKFDIYKYPFFFGCEEKAGSNQWDTTPDAHWRPLCQRAAGDTICLVTGYSFSVLQFYGLTAEGLTVNHLAGIFSSCFACSLQSLYKLCLQFRAYHIYRYISIYMLKLFNNFPGLLRV